MGFTTKGEDTNRVTYHERDDVTEWVHKFSEENGWDLSDVRNRALMWYFYKYQEGELDDPKVDKSAEEVISDINTKGKLRDLL